MLRGGGLLYWSVQCNTGKLLLLWLFYIRGIFDYFPQLVCFNILSLCGMVTEGSFMSEYWLAGMITLRMMVSTLNQIQNPKFTENAPNKK